MQTDKIVVGLDIGTTKVCAVVGKLDEHGKVEILGIGTAVSTGVDEGNVTNLDRTTDSIVEAIKQAEQYSGCNIGEVNVGVAGQHVRNIVQSGTYVRPASEGTISVADVDSFNSNMYRTVVNAGRQVIHVIPQEYVVDSKTRVSDPVGVAGTSMEADFQLIVADITSVRNIQTSVNRANLSIAYPEGLMLQPIASALAVLSDDEKEMGVVLVDIGGGTTDMAIYYKGILRYAAVIPLGGNIITSDIQQGCMILKPQAEKLKINHGHAIPAEVQDNDIITVESIAGRPSKEVAKKTLAQFIEARASEIVGLFHQELILSGYEDLVNAGIVITGGGANLRNIVEMFEYTTGKPTRVGIPDVYVSHKSVSQANSPSLATAIGLVRAGFYSHDYRVNSYRERYGYAKAENNNNGKAITSGSTQQKATKSPGLFDKLGTMFKKVILDDSVGGTEDYDK